MLLSHKVVDLFTIKYSRLIKINGAVYITARRAKKKKRQDVLTFSTFFIHRFLKSFCEGDFLDSIDNLF